MRLNGYNNTIPKTYQKNDNYELKNTKQVKSNSDNTTKDDTAVVYEKSEDSKQNVGSNEDIIAKLKFDVEERTNQLHSLVEKMFKKQGITFNNSLEMYDILRSGKFTADADTIAQAKKDISEDGYWGVKQTSDRLVSFAQALSGNDPKQADKMIAAVKKGFEQATKTWGGELPGICKDTLDATIKKLEAWRDNLNSTTSQEVTEEI